MKAIIVIIFALILVATGCTGKNGTVTTNGLTVTASFYPMYILAKNVLDGVPGVVLHDMAPPTTGCLHDYSLTADDMKNLGRSQVFIINGGGMEAFLESVAKEMTNLSIVNTSEGISFLSNEAGAEELINSHIFVSIGLYIRQLDNLERAMVRLDPAHANFYRANASSYKDKLTALQKAMHTALAPYKGVRIITFHEAFPYFAAEFGLEIAAVVEREPGSEPSAQELAQTIELIKAHKIKAIFSEPQYPALSAETIAKETGLKLYRLDPATTGPDDKDAYINAMESNLAVLQEALK